MTIETYLFRARQTRRVAGMLLAVLLLASPAWGQTGAMDFEAIDLNGAPYPASHLRGKVVLLDFWATWCGPCVKAIPRLNELKREFDEEDFEVLGLASYSGTLEDIRRFLEKRGAIYPIVMANEDIVEEFSVVGYPTYFLVDRRGRIAETYVGEIESQLDAVRSRIQELLGE